MSDSKPSEAVVIMIDTSRYSGHTPRPWRYLDSIDNDCSIWHKNNICVCQHARKLDANLIADAPLILEALKASEARVKELEAALRFMYEREPVLESRVKELEGITDEYHVIEKRLRKKIKELEAKLARELTDDELYNIVT